MMKRIFQAILAPAKQYSDQRERPRLYANGWFPATMLHYGNSAQPVLMAFADGSTVVSVPLRAPSGRVGCGSAEFFKEAIYWMPVPALPDKTLL